jgi:hypothetical protein
METISSPNQTKAKERQNMDWNEPRASRPSLYKKTQIEQNTNQKKEPTP